MTFPLSHATAQPPKDVLHADLDPAPREDGPRACIGRARRDRDPRPCINADGPRAVCTADVFRLCSRDVPRVDRIVACLKKERESLTPARRAMFENKS